MRRYLPNTRWAIALTGVIIISVVGTAVAAAITSAGIKDNTIQSRDIKNSTVAAIDLAPNSVTSPKILDGTIGAADLGTGSVTNAKLGIGAVSTSSIFDGTIAAADLASGVVTSAKVGMGAITSSGILNGTISAADIGDGEVGTSEIADGSIVLADIDTDAQATLESNGSVQILENGQSAVADQGYAEGSTECPMGKTVAGGWGVFFADDGDNVFEQAELTAASTLDTKNFLGKPDVPGGYFASATNNSGALRNFGVVVNCVNS